MAEFVTVKTFSDPAEAHILRSMLESQGIRAFMVDEHMVSLNPLHNVMVGGVKVQVHKPDMEQALEVVADFESAPPLDEEMNEIVCPNCGSTKLYTNYKSVKSIRGFFAMVMALLTFTHPLYLKHVYRCKDCGNEFKTE